jgi:transcriptional regulator with XRE-family HTH domain
MDTAMNIAMTMDVGARVRAIRQLHGLSQRELARRAGVTNGLISLVEMNRVSPSVSSLKKLLDGIPCRWRSSSPPTSTSVRQCSSPREISWSWAVVRCHCDWWPPSAAATDDVAAERYEPGAETGEQMLTHRGEEGGVVVRGSIEVTVGTETRVLGPGEAFISPATFRTVSATWDVNPVSWSAAALRPLFERRIHGNRNH